MSIDSGNKPPDELDLLVGSSVLGKYHIDRLIGRGGMGAVFQATNASIGKRGDGQDGEPERAGR